MWTITNDKGTLEGSVTGTVAIATISGRFAGKGNGDLEGQEIRGLFDGSVNNYIVDLTLNGRLTSKKNGVQ